MESHPPGLEVTPPKGSLLASSEAPSAAFLRFIRARYPFDYIRQLAGAWSSWDAFCDHHGLDPDEPTDAALVAYAVARVEAGAGWGTVDSTLRAVRLACEGSEALREGSVTIPAVRLLSDLHQQGVFEPSWQAPVLTVGQVLCLVETGGPDWGFVAAATYLAGLRGAEWSPMDREHIDVTDQGLVLLLPHTKTGDWQKARVSPLDGTPLDIAALGRAFLEVRGDRPGPLLGDRDGHRMSPGAVKARLTALAERAGVAPFSSYSLRRSMAVHADLMGVPGGVIRQRLRHVDGSQVYRRYIEPLLALMDRRGARAYYLSRRQVPPSPPAIHRVQRRATRLTKYAFIDGSVDDLLDGVDLPRLRVPLGLANVSRDGIDAGRVAFRRWAVFATDRGWDPVDPPGHGLPLWLLSCLDQMEALSAASLLRSVRIGWLDATGHDRIPGWDAAVAAAAGAAREVAGLVDPRHKSRLAEPDEVLSVCSTARAAVPPPSQRWAVTVLSRLTHASSSVQVVDVGIAEVTVRVDDRRVVMLASAEHGVLDPVLAGSVLGPSRHRAVADATKAAAVAAGQARSKGLRNWLGVNILAGSGARPSDMARARTQGVEIAPGGLAVILGVAKGKGASGLGRSRVLWAPHRGGDADPVDAWNAWSGWWPLPAKGPLLPSVVDRINAERSLDAAAVSALMSRTVRAAGLAPGLTAYGFRYARATELHQSGASDETIAEALGHTDLEVSRGYILDFDPFADGGDAEFIRSLT